MFGRTKTQTRTFPIPADLAAQVARDIEAADAQRRGLNREHYFGTPKLGERMTQFVPEDKIQEAQAIIRQEGAFIVLSSPVDGGFIMTVEY